MRRIVLNRIAVVITIFLFVFNDLSFGLAPFTAFTGSEDAGDFREIASIGYIDAIVRNALSYSGGLLSPGGFSKLLAFMLSKSPREHAEAADFLRGIRKIGSVYVVDYFDRVSRTVFSVKYYVSGEGYVVSEKCARDEYLPLDPAREPAAGRNILLEGIIDCLLISGFKADKYGVEIAVAFDMGGVSRILAPFLERKISSISTLLGDKNVPNVFVLKGSGRGLDAEIARFSKVRESSPPERRVCAIRVNFGNLLRSDGSYDTEKLGQAIEDGLNDTGKDQERGDALTEDDPADEGGTLPRGRKEVLRDLLRDYVREGEGVQKDEAVKNIIRHVGHDLLIDDRSAGKIFTFYTTIDNDVLRHELKRKILELVENAYERPASLRKNYEKAVSAAAALTTESGLNAAGMITRLRELKRVFVKHEFTVRTADDVLKTMESDYEPGPEREWFAWFNRRVSSASGEAAAAADRYRTDVLSLGSALILSPAVIEWVEDVLGDYSDKFLDGDRSGKIVFIGGGCKKAWQAARLLAPRYGIPSLKILYLDAPATVIRSRAYSDEILYRYFESEGLFDGDEPLTFVDEGFLATTIKDVTGIINRYRASHDLSAIEYPRHYLMQFTGIFIRATGGYSKSISSAHKENIEAFGNEVVSIDREREDETADPVERYLEGSARARRLAGIEVDAAGNVTAQYLEFDGLRFIYEDPGMADDEGGAGLGKEEKRRLAAFKLYLANTASSVKIIGGHRQDTAFTAEKFYSQYGIYRGQTEILYEFLRRRLGLEPPFFALDDDFKGEDVPGGWRGFVGSIMGRLGRGATLENVLKEAGITEPADHNWFAEAVARSYDVLTRDASATEKGGFIAEKIDWHTWETSEDIRRSVHSTAREAFEMVGIGYDGRALAGYFRKRNGIAFIVRHEGAVVGFATAHPIRGTYQVHATLRGVRPDMLGKGLGRMLHDIVVTEARARGYKVMTGESTMRNTPEGAKVTGETQLVETTGARLYKWELDLNPANTQSAQEMKTIEFLLNGESQGGDTGAAAWTDSMEQAFSLVKRSLENSEERSLETGGETRMAGSGVILMPEVSLLAKVWPRNGVPVVAIVPSEEYMAKMVSDNPDIEVRVIRPGEGLKDAVLWAISNSKLRGMRFEDIQIVGTRRRNFGINIEQVILDSTEKLKAFLEGFGFPVHGEGAEIFHSIQTFAHAA